MVPSEQSYQVPDYTAYDQILSAFRRLIPIPTALRPEVRISPYFTSQSLKISTAAEQISSRY
jgi:hypothetical protein